MQAFADRDKYLSDREFVNIPLDFLLSLQHSKEEAITINMDKAVGELFINSKDMVFVHGNNKHVYSLCN